MIKKLLYFAMPAYLSVKNEQLVIETKEVINAQSYPYAGSSPHKVTVPLVDVGFVIVDNPQITITHVLLEKCVENNIAVVNCDAKRMPCGMLLPLAGNTLQSERFAQQINASVPLKKQLWQQTVVAKIRNQGAVLRQVYGRAMDDFIALSKDVKSNDSSNREAHAANIYWREIFPQLPNFARGRDDEPPNNLLNYGYAILRAIVARALVGAGLLPTLGIHHCNRYNAYCLADDIMEPYRPYVDLMVIKIVAENDDVSILRKAFKTTLLGLPVVDVEITQTTRPLMNAVNDTCTSLQKCFASENTELLYPKINEKNK